MCEVVSHTEHNITFQTQWAFFSLGVSKKLSRVAYRANRANYQTQRVIALMFKLIRLSPVTDLSTLSDVFFALIQSQLENRGAGGYYHLAPSFQLGWGESQTGRIG